jgi:hypothetical protein
MQPAPMFLGRQVMEFEHIQSLVRDKVTLDIRRSGWFVSYMSNEPTKQRPHG